MNEASFTVGPDDLTAANRLHFKNLFSAERWTFALLVSATLIAVLMFGFDLGFEAKYFLYMLAAV